MFSFVSKTEKEIQEALAAKKSASLLPSGTYPFTVKTILSSTSKSGNPMLTVTLNVLDAKGGVTVVTDYLLYTDNMIFKLKHFCESIGLGDQYSKGQLNIQSCINRSGSVKLKIQKGNAKEDGTFFDDKNAVVDYVVSLKVTSSVQVASVDNFSDDITF